MNENIANKFFGESVLACDEHWGSYIGELVGTFKTPIGICAHVKIIEMVEKPSQYAIIFQDKYVHRQPHAYGSIVNFNLFNVLRLEGTPILDKQVGIGLEDILKVIVATALETRLGHTVLISNSEWEDAKGKALNNVYNEKFCFFRNVSADDFINRVVDVLAVSKAAVA